jgi:hypothetical protein
MSADAAAAGVAAASVAASPLPPPVAWVHASRAPLDPAPLQALLSLTQPEQLERIVRTVFRARHEGVTAERRNEFAAMLSVGVAETDAVS